MQTVIEVKGAQGSGIHVQAFNASGQCVPAADDKLDNKLGRNGGHGQIQPP